MENINKEIVKRYLKGVDLKGLSSQFDLSQDDIKAILEGERVAIVNNELAEIPKITKPKQKKVIKKKILKTPVKIKNKTHSKFKSADEELFIKLKILRKEIAYQKRIPPFVIFQNKSLEQIVEQKPLSSEELSGIWGVGIGKTRKYGKQFIEVVKSHLETFQDRTI